MSVADTFNLIDAKESWTYNGICDILNINGKYDSDSYYIDFFSTLLKLSYNLVFNIVLYIPSWETFED